MPIKVKKDGEWVEVGGHTSGGIVNDKIQEGDTKAEVVDTGDGNNGYFTVETNGQEKLRIDSSGNLGIGVDNPSGFLAGANRLVVGNGSDNQGITIYSGQDEADYGSIYFADGTSGEALNRGQIRYEQNNEIMSFYANNTERLKIGGTGEVPTVTIQKASTEGLVLKPASDTDTFQINFNKQDDSTSGAISYDFSAESLKLKSGGTDRLTLDSTGNLLPDANSTDGTNGYTLGGTGNYWKAVYAKTFIGSDLDANATTATTLKNTRTFQISGDGEAPAQDFDGSQNVDLSLTLNDVNTNTGYFGNSTNVAKFNVNSKGLITEVENVGIDISTLNSQGADSVKITANISADEVKYLWMGDDSTVGNYDALEVDTKLVYDNGNLAIGATDAGTVKYRLYVDGGALGNAAGNVVNIAEFMSPDTAHNNRLQIRNIRNQAGNDWRGTRQRIQRMIDDEPMGYIDLGSGIDGEDANVNNNAGRDIVFGHAWNDNGTYKYKDDFIIKKSTTENSAHFIPGHDSTNGDDANGQDLGSPSAHFRELFVKKIVGVTVDGSINEANQLSSTRTFQISGDDATATAQDFDGTQNVDLPLVLANTDVTADTYGDSTNVGQFTVDSKGRITAAENVGIDISNKEALSATKLNPGAIINVEGDVTSTETTEFTGESEYVINTTLATLDPDPAGTYGSATVVPKITVNSKGLVTSVEDTTITIDISGTKAGTAGALDPGAAINLENGTYDATHDFTSAGIVSFTGLSAYTIPAQLNTTGVSANTYGSNTTVPVFNVDAKGRIKSVVNTPIDFPDISTSTALNAQNLLTLSASGNDETEYRIPFTTDDADGGSNVYKGYQISNVADFTFTKNSNGYGELYSTTLRSGLLRTMNGTGDNFGYGSSGQVLVSGGSALDQNNNIVQQAWRWETLSIDNTGVTDVKVSQTGRDEDCHQPITVSTPNTNTKQIDIAVTSNAHGSKWVQDNQPMGNEVCVGDIWYDTSGESPSPVTNFIKNMIIMWYGRIDSVPTGWQLCNGENDTPDLRNKFVIGASVDAGLAQYAHTTVEDTGDNSRKEGGYRDAIVVTHDHSPSNNGKTGAGDHTHDITDPGHAHGGIVGTSNLDDGGMYTGPGYVLASQTGSNSTGIDKTDDDGTHSHTIDEAGDSGIYRNLPPYFALCYIMKL